MRLVTRSDFDGLVCALLFRKMNMVTEIKFVHPKDVQDGLVEVTKDDILANLPYAPNCGLWFDHHSSEQERVGDHFEFTGANRAAPSAARVVYDYYGGRAAFGDIDELMAAVDKADSAQFTADEILNPTGYNLLAFIMDARTGLGRHHGYTISNYQLMEMLADRLGDLTLDEIMNLPDVRERIVRYFELDARFRDMLRQYTRTEGNVIVSDLRGAAEIFPGNRFMVYALYPEQNISIWVVDGKQRQNCVIACGHSIVNRTARTDVGALMLKYGGGGHRAAGTCQVPYEQTTQVLSSLIRTMRSDG